MEYAKIFEGGLWWGFWSIFSCLFFFPAPLPPPRLSLMTIFLINPNAPPVCWGFFAWLCIPRRLERLPSSPLARLTLQKYRKYSCRGKTAARGRRPLRGGGSSRTPLTTPFHPAPTPLTHILSISQSFPFHSWRNTWAWAKPLPSPSRKTKCQENNLFRCFFRLPRTAPQGGNPIFPYFPPLFLPGTSTYIPCRYTFVPSYTLCPRSKKYGY